MARSLRRLRLLALSAAAALLVCEGAYRVWLYFGTPRYGAPGAQFEIYGVGESTLVGEPFDPKISVPRILQYLFGNEIAGRPIVVKNLAERGNPLYPQVIAFERALASRDPREPGVVLIMSGHNEEIAPGDPDARRPFLPSILTEKSALVRDAVLALRRRRIMGREKSLAAYEYYLRRVIEAAAAQGLVPIVATMASNISRIEPNYDGADGDALDALMVHGMKLEMEEHYLEARDLYIGGRAAYARAAALLAYRAGRCEEAVGQFAAAQEDYWAAVDRDPRLTFGRATRPQNELVRHLAREYRIPLVDAVQIFADHSPHGSPGDDLFMDGQHPTVDGYLLIADAYAHILSEQFGVAIPHPLRDAQEVVTALEFGERDFPGAIVDAGSWLIATSVGHPFPTDRMALAAKRFGSLVGKGDDFSAWLGIALTQAAMRGGLLRNPSAAPKIAGSYARSYRIALPELPALLPKFHEIGVDDDVIARVRDLGERLRQLENAAARATLHERRSTG
jgi:tetratricopeptide (TPR) repeat protein